MRSSKLLSSTTAQTNGPERPASLVAFPLVQELSGNIAVVTGAGSGIGRALALAFGGEGMRVVAADVEAAALDETMAQLTAAGVDATSRVTDVSRFDDVVALADHTQASYGGVDVLCNNAGVFAGGLLWERPASDFEWSLGVNLWGILHAARAFVPGMIERGTEAHIVNTVSMAGVCTTPYSGPYDVSKFAALAATECLAHDLAMVGANINVSMLCPGLVATNIGHAERNRPDALAAASTPDADFVANALVDQTAKGLPPSAVAEMVLDAIRTERFFVPTNASHAPQMRERLDALLAGHVPPVPTFD
jgi:NAD(P)-dependent dehydrogenase (short-subunit alcohol dehydrogenase family)